MGAGHTEAAEMLSSACVSFVRHAWDKQQTLLLGMLNLALKAFNSVDRNPAWQILLGTGAPAKLVALIRDLHTGHSACVRGEVDAHLVTSATGFKQGCVLAPDLFSLCLNTVVWSLLPVLRPLGLRISYKIHDGQPQVGSLKECRIHYLMSLCGLSCLLTTIISLLVNLTIIIIIIYRCSRC